LFHLKFIAIIAVIVVIHFVVNNIKFRTLNQL
jgi:hypothetical protein